MIKVVGLSLLLLLYSCTGETRAEEPPLPIDDYYDLIQESQECLEAEQGGIGSKEASCFRKGCFPGLKVQDADGELVPVDCEGLLRWVRKSQDSSEGRNELAAHLRALSRQLSCKTTEGVVDGASWADSRSLLDEVYRGREFRHLAEYKKPAWLGFLQNILKALEQWLEDHLGGLEGISGKWFEYSFDAVVVLLGAVLIIWIYRLFGPVGWRWKFPGLKTPALVGTKKSADTDWKKWREEAKKRAREGIFREAIRFLFISALLEGHQRGWWVYEAEATNKEHLAQVKDQPKRRRALQRLIVLYEGAWYGLGQPGKEEFHACEQWVLRMEAAA